MFSLLQSRHPLAFLFLIPITAGLAFAHFWFAPEIVEIDFSILQKFYELPKLELTYAYFGLLCLNSVMLSIFFNRMNLMDYFSHVGGLFYAILSFAFVQLGDIHLLISDFFVLVGVIFLVRIKSGEDAKAIVFNASIMFGISFVFNPYYLPLIILIFSALARSKNFVFREYFIVFSAILVVASYLSFYYFFYELSWQNPIAFLPEFEWPSLEILIAFGCANFLIFLAFVTRSRTLGSPGIRIEKLVRFFFVGYFIQLLSFILFQLFKVDTSFQIALFLAFYTGYAYNHSSLKWLYNFFGYAVLSCAILQHLDLF